MFLRKSLIKRDPLAVTMSGVRLGEKALQIGEGEARVMALIAAKTGLTGRAAIVVLEERAARRVRHVIDEAGVLAEVGVGDRPDDAAFDVIVVHDVRQTIGSSNAAVRTGWLQLCLRVLRSGGRIVTIEQGAPVGLRALFGGGSQGRALAAGGDTIAMLRSAGFAAVRVLGDREGLRFIEGLKTV
jgi:ubiquinone/menaquinone biosynthesis C-methylase UbiE